MKETEDENNIISSKILELDTTNETDSRELTKLLNTISSTTSKDSNQWALTYKIKGINNSLTTWTVLPGSKIDPGLLNYITTKHVPGSILWDYKIDLTQNYNNYYVLSNIPQSLKAVLSASPFINNNEEVLKNVLLELSKCGISIGREALTTANKAHGAIGLANAVSVIQKSSLWKSKKLCGGFLIPVDSFIDLIGGNSDQKGTFADFLFVQLWQSQKLQLSFFAIECKYSSSTFNESGVTDALDQATSTYNKFLSLVEAAKADEGVLERMGLVKILYHGIRMSELAERATNLNIQEIIRLISNGEFELQQPKYQSVLIISEQINPEYIIKYPNNRSLIIRISPNDWIWDLDKDTSNDILKAISHNDISPVSDKNVSDIQPVEKEDEPKEEPQTQQQEEFVLGVTSTSVDVAADSSELPENTPKNIGDMRIEVGCDIRKIPNQPYFYIPTNTRINQLNIGIVGDLGTGKTQIVRSFIYQVTKSTSSNRGLTPKFLILDTKGDYNGSGEKESDIRFTTDVDLQIIKPYEIQLNLFDIRKTVDSYNPALDKADFFVDIINKVYGSIKPNQNFLLTQAILNSYEKKRYKPNQESYLDFVAPTIYDIYNEYRELNGNKIDTTHTVLAKIINSKLFHEDPNECLDFESFFHKTTVFDLKRISQIKENMRLVMVIVLNMYKEYMLNRPKTQIITHNGSSYRQIDSYLLIDEANEIMKFEFPVLEDVLLKGREFGIGVILSSQYLSHFRQRNIDYSENLLTWFIHKIGQLSKNDLKNIGIIEVNEDMVENIKSLENHECLFKTTGINGVIIKERAYWEIMGTL